MKIFCSTQLATKVVLTALLAGFWLGALAGEAASATRMTKPPDATCQVSATAPGPTTLVPATDPCRTS